MRLKNIEMQGFKSFADKIYLDFNPGITAIVGPNGSGKSNISDAIRWVMGEQSIKSLRGSKMEDVIFSGTESRKPLGFAEVTLTLDNSDNYFSLDFPEITVTRRVYRSGDGEYYINKTLCRLKDIHELFMDTGLGRDGYSIIGQGKIDGILSSKSDERRQIFEEAAGISKYKYRKIEAERKLEHTTENLVRVEDILNELESRIGPLERQSEKAKKYLLLRDEMRELDINVSVINAEKTKTEQNKLKNDIDIILAQIEEVKNSISASDAEVAELYEKLSIYDKDIEECRQSDKETAELINNKRNNISLLKSDIEHNKNNINRINNEITVSKNEVNKIDGDLSVLNDTLAEYNSKNKGFFDSLNELSDQEIALNNDLEEKNRAIEEIKSKIIDISSQISTLNASNSSLDILSENFIRRKNEIETEINNKKKGSKEFLSSKEEIQNKSVLCKTEIESLKDKITKLDTILKKLNEKQKELTDNKNKYIILLNQKQARKTMLEEMERDYEGYARGVKAIMTAYDKGNVKNCQIHGPLSKLISTEKKYIPAIETALGAANQNIVTETEKDAKVAIEYLKKNNYGRATFLPITAIKSKPFNLNSAKKYDGFISVASELVNCDRKYKEIIKSYLSGTVVCDTLDNAIIMAKENGYKFRIVTIDGDIIQTGGAMTGGSKNKSTGSLSRSEEISSLNVEIFALKDKTDRYDEEYTKIAAEIESKRYSFKENETVLQEKNQELVKLDSEFGHMNAMIENIKLSSAQLDNELGSIIKRLRDIESEKQANLSEKEIKTTQSEKLEYEINLKQNDYNLLLAKSEQLSKNITDLNISRNTILKDIELLNERIMGLASDKTVHIEADISRNNQIDLLKNKNSNSLDIIKNLECEIHNLDNFLADFNTKIGDLSEKRLSAEKLIRERQEAVKDTQEQLFSLTKQHAKMDSQLSKLQLDVEGIVNRLWEDYELPYSEAAAIKPKDGFDYKLASSEIKSLKEKIRTLGNINIDAIEEYKELKERFDFLKSQSSDLKKAKSELNAIISDMQELMQTKFAKQFRIINENFNRVFCELFGGGRANLILVDPNNILESGIEIEAQPPGKKLQSLTLLSGGERAFTAIALLFSMLDVRPTPFCILDEIEAALDDINVYRTADYLKRYSNKTQFIVVTHRRGTMEAANILYGVTMQERGISKLLYLNIDDIQN